MKERIVYKLPVTVFREGDAFVAYTPSLDLSSVGTTEHDAKRMFVEAVETFFEELTEMGTLDVVLKDLGWTRHNGALQPPKVVDHSMMQFAALAAA